MINVLGAQAEDERASNGDTALAAGVVPGAADCEGCAMAARLSSTRGGARARAASTVTTVSAVGLRRRGLRRRRRRARRRARRQWQR